MFAILGISTWVWFHQRSTSARASSVNQRKTSAVPVTAAIAANGSIDVYFTGLGTVTPLATITVKTRIDGELMEVNYREGEIVHKGAQLVQIDPRPFQVQLEQAEAQLAKDLSALQNARTDLQRYETLITKNAVTQQVLVTQRSTVQQAEAVIKTDQAAIDSATTQPHVLPADGPGDWTRGSSSRRSRQLRLGRGRERRWPSSPRCSP